MVEIGKVLRIEEEKAVVLLSSFEHCEKCRICMTENNGKRTLKVDNVAKAKVGDSVEVFIPDGMISKSSFLIFILPLLAFLIGYFFAWFFSRSETLSAVLGAITFVLTFYALFLYEKKLNQIKKETLPFISRILGRENSSKLSSE